MKKFVLPLLLMSQAFFSFNFIDTYDEAFINLDLVEALTVERVNTGWAVVAYFNQYKYTIYIGMEEDDCYNYIANLITAQDRGFIAEYPQRTYP